MSLRPLVELRCDGPTCSTPTKGVFELPSNAQPNIPDTWHTLHSEPGTKDSHFCSLACLALWAAKATGQWLMKSSPNNISVGNWNTGGVTTHMIDG